MGGEKSHTSKGDALHEVIREWLLVQEDIRITEALVKAVFHLFHALCYALEIAIARQHNDGRIGSTSKVKRWIIWPMVPVRDHVLVGL